MSSKKETKKSVGNLSLTERIMAMLNAGDEGKINNFLLKVLRDREKEIKAREQNIKVITFEHENKLIELNEKLEDAENDYKDAFLNVESENVENNAKQSAYIDSYLRNIENKKDSVQHIKGLISKRKISFKDSIEEIELEIKELKNQIAEIKG